ncbi:hypothetical protein HFN89_01315 [Rhizobium laguerreae]|nr:hypothetical protein [Rhizobium laguerreae]
MRTCQNQFPNFDATLPEIDGFVDDSWKDDICPSLLNEDLNLKLMVDYIDPRLSEVGKQRAEGKRGRYSMHVPGEHTDIVSSDNLSDILVAIAEVEAARSIRPSQQPKL